MTVASEKRTLLTIVTETVLEDALLRDLEKLGVRGYTVCDARGRGNRGVRNGRYEEAANIRIEIICPRALAEQAVAHIQAQYYANYAMVAYLQDVEVLRPEKF